MRSFSHAGGEVRGRTAPGERLVAEGLVRAGLTRDRCDRAHRPRCALHVQRDARRGRGGSPVSRRVGHRASVVSAHMSIYASVFRTTLRAHAFVYEHTDGLIGHRVLGVPCLMLRTTGRKTGQTRTNSLVYAEDGDRYLVVASKGGAPKAPAWLLNLRAKPEVQVQIGRTRFQATGTEIGPDDPDYARLWKLVNDNNGNRYDAYQKKTTRPIPVVALSRTT